MNKPVLSALLQHRRVSCKKPETWSKSDITMRVDPEHDEMIDLQKTGAHQ